MSDTSEWLADRVASLLPKTVTTFVPKASAAACHPFSPWTSRRTTCGPTGHCCDSSRQCHLSCNGHASICTPWVGYFCWG